MATWSWFRSIFVCLILAAIYLAPIATGSSIAQSQTQQPYRPAPENLEARRWFQDAKFGLFVHWGVYSVKGDGEWVMNNSKIPISEYEKLPSQFNPTEFNPAEWVALAKAAGMKYITITSKHHDGFAMYDSKVSDWDIVDRTPYKKDVMKLLADECQKQGIKLFFYYSQLDWHHPDYFPRGRTGLTAGRAESGEWFKYIDYMDEQLKELLTNYGPIGGIWFDGMWDRPKADWRFEQTYKLIHSLQPAALVGSNHHLKPFPGEDFQMFEKDLPGQKTSSFNAEAEVGDLPLETCETINGAWGYNANDKRFKSTKALIHYLVKATGYNANFLLNVGPMPSGKIQPEFADRLKQVGAWLEKNGETIYGTRGGPLTPRPWGVTTRKGNKVYLHILDWSDPVLAMPKMPKKVKSATFFKDGSKVEFLEHDKYGLFIRNPQGFADEFDTIVVLELAEK
ncbi:MAG TPA: alpha-L-fucosidase [Blastocatellia bacterium]|nr:alpha-L-fucosidase [Blastocatellia bacterium]